MSYSDADATKIRDRICSVNGCKNPLFDKSFSTCNDYLVGWNRNVLILFHIATGHVVCTSEFPPDCPCAFSIYYVTFSADERMLHVVRKAQNHEHIHISLQNIYWGRKYIDGTDCVKPVHCPARSLHENLPNSYIFYTLVIATLCLDDVDSLFEEVK